MIYRQYKNRPEEFRIAEGPHFLKRSASLLGLGRTHKTTQFTDSSAYKNHGTLTAMDPGTDWLFDSYLSRWVLDHDGSDDYVSVPSSSRYDIGTDVTSPLWVGGWFRPTRSNVNYETLVSKGESANKYQWAIYWCGTGGAGVAAFYAVWFNTANTLASSCLGAASRSLATWYRVDACWTPAAGVQLYVNGVADGSTSAGTGTRVTTTTEQMCIGRRGSVLPFAGRSSDVSVRRKYPSSGELDTLADPSNVMLSGLILPPTRKLWPAAVAGGGSTLLVVPGSQCVVQSPEVALVQHSALTVSASNVLVQSPSPSLIQHHALTGTSSDVAVTSPSPTLVQHHAIAVPASNVVVNSPTVDLVYHHVLEIPASNIVVTSPSISWTADTYRPMQFMVC